MVIEFITVESLEPVRSIMVSTCIEGGVLWLSQGFLVLGVQVERGCPSTGLRLSGRDGRVLTTDRLG